MGEQGSGLDTNRNPVTDKSPCHLAPKGKRELSFRQTEVAPVLSHHQHVMGESYEGTSAIRVAVNRCDCWDWEINQSEVYSAQVHPELHHRLWVAS